MEKMRMESPDLTAGNIEKIGALFPNCITETVDENGRLKKAINFDLLRQMLSGDVVEGDEAYEFTWVGKRAAIAEANKPIRKTLRPCLEESKNWDTTENLYIEGDNLEVLKLLQENYLGQVKLIYIDPPYNTGNDFIYRDDFKQSADEYDEQLGLYDDEENRLFKNTDTNGRFHSDWCSMMYSRLMLTRNLLSDDGALFVSIDDNEIDNLKKICNEIFGEENFIACLVWEKTRKNDARFFSSGHEYIVVYVKSEAYLRERNVYWREDKPGAKEIFAEYERLSAIYGDDFAAIERDLREYYSNLPKEHPAKKHSRYNKVDERGVWRDDNMSWPGGGGPRYDVIHPVTGKPCKVPPSGWRFPTLERMKEMIDNGYVIFREDHTEPPIKKSYLVRKVGRLSDEESIGKQVMGTYFYRSALQATNELASLIGSRIFDYPKDREILMRLINYVTSINGNDIILDFFSGSATTAHAVMQLNAEDGGNRKFIMVQLPEPCNEKSKAYNSGYQTICDIGKERIRRAGEKIKDESPLTTQNLDVGFRVFKLADTNMKDVYYSADEIDQQDLFDMVSNIKEDRTDLDLLFGCLLEWGLPLSLPYTSEQMEGCTVHTYNDGDLIACFNDNIPESVIREIAKRKPLRAVFRDSGFASSPAKINVFEIFKLYMPESAGDITKRVKVL